MENVSATCNVRVKRCSTLMNSSPMLSAVVPKQNGVSDRTRKEDASRQGLVENPDLSCPSMKSLCRDGQCANADTTNLLNACSCSELGSQNSSNMKASDSPGDDTSCISRLDTANTVVANCCSDADRKNDGSGSSDSVNSFPSSEKAVNGQQSVLYKTRGNSEESGHNHVEMSVKGIEPCKADISDSPPLRESSPKGEGSVLSEEKGESSSITMSSREIAEVSKHLDSKELKEKQCLPMEQPHGAKLPLPSQPAENNSGAVIAEEDVRVCDICGDVGREDLLAICTKCNDGAEHIYCMHIKMEKVPGGDWLCEECEINQEFGRERQKKVEETENILKRSSSKATTQELECLGSSNLKKKLQVDVEASDFKKRTANAVSSPKLPSKISSGISEAFPINKRKILEIHNEAPREVHPKKGLSRHSKSSSPMNVAEGQVKPLPLSCSERSTFSVNKSRLLKSRSFNIGDSHAKDFQLQQGSDRSAIFGDCGREGHGRLLCKSQSFKDAHTEFSVPNILKAHKTLLSTSPRVKDQIRVKQTGDQPASPPKSLPRLGSSNAKTSNITCREELVSKPSAAASNHAQERNRGNGHLSNSPKWRCKTLKGSGDQHVENQRVVKNLKAEPPVKTNELDVNRSPRRSCLDISVPSQRGVIPLVDFIWKGGFEVSTSGGRTDLFPSIQAHKSNCASDKVDGIVVKFPQKIELDEVPRLSAWPSQFRDTEVMENNIALFFFAESHESYETYKSLLKRLTANDLALKGYVNGVELLIFCSKVLPPESQRWNNLVYLWGVFRIMSVKSTEKELASQNQYCSLGPSTGSLGPHLPVTRGTLTAGQQKTDLFPSNGNCSLLQTSNSSGLPFASSTRISEIPEPVASSSETKVLPMPANNHQLSIINSSNGNCSSLQMSNSSGLPLASPTRISEIPEPVASSSEAKVLPMPANNHGLSIMNSSPIAPGDERNVYRTREFDLNVGGDNNSRDLASSSYDEVRLDKKMKGIVTAPPEPYCHMAIQFFEVSPLFYAKDHASSSGSAAMRIARDKEQSTVEDVDLELSLGPINLSGKRKVSSLSFEAVDDRTFPVKRLRRNEESSSLSLSLSLAPPS